MVNKDLSGKATSVEGEDVQVRVGDLTGKMPNNVPYVQIRNKKGEVVNPITKDKPYYSPFPNRKQRRDLDKSTFKNPKNNKKGKRVVITKIGDLTFTKIRVYKQTIEAKSMPILDEEFKIVARKKHPRKTIVHNQVKNN